MNAPTLESSNPAPEPTTPTRTPALQSRAMAERITAAEKIIKRALQDAELLEWLTPYGCDADAFEAGLQMQQAAKDSFNARQQVIAAKREASEQLRLQFLAIQTAYADYRRIGRALFRSHAVRPALGLAGNLPYDQQQFIQHVRAVYHTVLFTPEYAAAFAGRGYTQEKFTALLAAMDEWVAAGGVYADAVAANISATLTRNMAMEALDEWMYQLRIAGRIAARQHPQVTVKLGI